MHCYQVKYANYEPEINVVAYITVYCLDTIIALNGAWQEAHNFCDLCSVDYFDMLNTNQKSFFSVYTIHVHIPSSHSPVVPIPL